MPSAVAWQLKLFSKSLKKRQKLALLLRQIGDVRGRRCLLVTNGDNNGALNHHFRARGGEWVWVENEEAHIAEMIELLGNPVLKGEPDRIPVADSSLDVVVSIDVHEHLTDCAPFNEELRRVVRPGGIVVVTTPNGDPWKPVTVLKQLVGMTRERYGHEVIGYNVRQHESMLSGAGLVPIDSGSYSKFFTEMIELAINFAYVKLLAKGGEAEVQSGTIAPSTEDQLRSVRKTYRLYALAYPFLKAVSMLDVLLFFFTGYAVSVQSRRPAG
jgi:SAM-dependent methyltransferase